jgi:hypothetical protein
MGNNTKATAQKWVAALGRQADVPFAKALQDHFARASITGLCECGCNSFECVVQECAGVMPLFGTPPLEDAYVELVFSSDAGDPISFTVHTDSRGLLSGMDIFVGMLFQGPVPDDATVGDLLHATAPRSRREREILGQR